jgi:hypothetical protein
MSLTIKVINSNQLRNNEHFQFCTEFYDLVRKENPAILQIIDQFDDFDTHYWNEDKALQKIAKSATTDQINKYDKDFRDPTCRGLVATNRAAINHFDPEVVMAAKRLKVIFDTFGNITKLPLNEETSAIYNLVQEIKKNNAADMQKVGLTEWVNALDAQNKEFDKLVKSRNDESAAQTELKMKQMRIETDKSYQTIITRIMAFITIEGEDVYVSFVRKLNSFIDKYNNAIAQRRGRAKAKKTDDPSIEEPVI